MARHHHVDMFFDSVDSVRFRGVSATGKDIRMLDKRNHIRCVTTACPLNVISMNGSVFESCSRPLNETRLVERITVDLTLDIMLITNSVVTC